MTTVTKEDWSKGLNNRANWRNMPDGYVRHLVNLDPLPGGTLGLRVGYRQVAAGTNIRGAIAYGHRVVFADGADLKEYNTQTDSTKTIGTIAGTGLFTGVVLNNELFICTENQALRYNGQALRRWGVPSITSQPVPSIVGGSLAAGTYEYAVTLSINDEEGGTSRSGVVTVPANSGLQFSLPTNARLYMSPVSGGALYFQHAGSGSYTATTVRDDLERLTTQFMGEPYASHILSASNSSILMATDNVLWFTAPMRPHLRSGTGFIQFDQRITMVAEVEGGVFVAAGETFFVTGLGTADMNQLQKLPFGAVSNTQTYLPDNTVAWMTKYGLAVGTENGDVKLLSEPAFVPEHASSGASGVVEYNGNKQVVTTMRADRGANPLAASDYYVGEVITP